MTKGDKNLNPLSGLRVPSLEDAVRGALDRIHGTFDLSNPMQRERLKAAIIVALGQQFQYEVKSAVEDACSKAITHVFKIMADSEYQEKRRQRLERSRKIAAVRRAEKEKSDREAGMDYSKSKFVVSKATIQ